MTHITDAVRPLEAFAEDNNFKLYLLDTGLLSSLYRARMEDLLPQGNKAAVFRGGLTENYVCQQLIAAGIKPYYWGVASKSEVEFVYETANGRVIPVEVKSGKNVGAKSVRSFAEKYEVPYTVKVTAKKLWLRGRCEEPAALCCLHLWRKRTSGVGGMDYTGQPR